MTKVCVRCHKEKPVAEFAPARKGRVSNLCVPCKVESNAVYRRRRREWPEHIRALCSCQP